MAQVRLNNKILTLPPKLLLGTGGQASVFQHPLKSSLAIKVFHQPSEETGRRLLAMQNNPPFPMYEQRPWFRKESPCFAWVLDVVFDTATTEMVGFVMPKISDKAPLQMIANPARRVRAISPKWLLHTAESLAMRVYCLAWSGYLMGDLSLLNAMVDRFARVTIIDTDSLYFETKDEIFRCPVGVLDLQPPELMGAVYREVERAKDQVAWSLLVVVHLLVRHNHPFACHYIGTSPTPPSLDKRVQDGLWPESGKHKDYVPHKGLIDRRRFPEAFNALCQRMFEAGHTDRTKRPSILEILTVLREML